LQSYWVIVTDNNDCQATDDIDVYFNPCTGLLENTNTFTIEIFPNPTKGTVTITVIGLKTKFDILLTNQLGEILEIENVNQNAGQYSSELDLSNYTKGIYFLKFQDNNGEILKIEKVVKN